MGPGSPVQVRRNCLTPDFRACYDPSIERISRLSYLKIESSSLAMRLPIQSMQSVLIKPQDSEDNLWFRSVIVDFVPDRELVIVMPTQNDSVKEDGAESIPDVDPPVSSPEPIIDEDEDELVGGGMELIFSTGTRLDVEISFSDGIRRFASMVKRLDMSYGGSLRIAWPTEGTRIQRRDFVRVDSSIPMVVRYEDAETGTLVKVNAPTIDLSAGGARLQMASPIPDDTRIEMELQSTSLKGQTLQGRVVRSALIESNRRDKRKDFWVAVQFLGVDEGLRNRLTQLVFDIQREQMRRSLG